MAGLPTALSYPLVNGGMTDFADISVNFGVGPLIAVPFTGISSLEYGYSMNGSEVHGMARSPLGKTLGTVSFSGGMTMYKDSYDPLIVALLVKAAAGGVQPPPGGAPQLPTTAGGYAQVFFNLQVTYSFVQGVITFATLYGCTLKSARNNHHTGGGALEISIDLAPVYITENTTAPTSDLGVLALASAVSALGSG